MFSKIHIAIGHRGQSIIITYLNVCEPCKKNEHTKDIDYRFIIVYHYFLSFSHTTQ